MSDYADIFPMGDKPKTGYEDIFAPAPVKKAAAPEVKYDPTEGMSGLDKFRAGMGKTFYDVGRGVGQLIGTYSEKDATDAKKRDAALMNTGAGVAGNIAGGVALAAPTALIPGANTVTGAALVGAGMGAIQPVAEGDSRFSNTALGAAGGAIGQGVANGLGKLVSPVKTALTPEQQRLAQAALNEGIPLNAADLTGSKALSMTNSVLSNLPFTGGAEAAREAAKKTAFTKAVMAKAGATTDNAAPDTLKSLMDARGQTIGNIAKRSTVNMDNALLSDLGNAQAQYSKVLDPNQAAIINRNLDELLNYGATIPGETYQSTRGVMGRLQQNIDPNVKQAAGQIKAALDAAAGRSLPAADNAAWQEARQQYATLKTVSKAMESSAGNSGDIPASQLRTAVKQANPYTFPRGDGQLNDLARIGEQFVRDKNPNSGTAQRLFIQNLLTGGATGAVAGGAAYGAGGDPTMIMAAAGVGLLGPKAFQAALNSKAIQSYLVSNAGRQATAGLLQRFASPVLTGTGASGLLAYPGQ